MSMRKCIVCKKELESDALQGSDEWFFCDKHKSEHRRKLANDSKNVIRAIAKEVLR